MIFCVEDDNAIRDLMIYALNSAGFHATGFTDGTSFLDALKEERPELVMLDIMLPGDDGIALLKKIRSHAATADIPVIMATAKGTEYDKVLGLDLGADDYLAKPFGMMEMISRVKAVLRRTTLRDGGSMLKAGQIRMNTAEHTVYVLLQLFLRHPGKVFTRDQLLEQVWDAAYSGETRTVDVHIGTLRTKLGRPGDLIKTVRGVGYRMEEQV